MEMEEGEPRVPKTRINEMLFVNEMLARCDAAKAAAPAAAAAGAGAAAAPSQAMK